MNEIHTAGLIVAAIAGMLLRTSGLGFRWPGLVQGPAGRVRQLRSRFLFFSVFLLLIGIAGLFIAQGLLQRPGVLFADQSYSGKEFLENAAAIFVDAFIGIAIGYVITLLFEAVTFGRMSKFNTTLTLLVAGLLLAAGPYRSEFTQLSSLITGLDTPYFKISFDKGKNGDVNFTYTGERDSKASTDFQAGVFALRTSLVSPLRRALYIRDYCLGGSASNTSFPAHGKAGCNFSWNGDAPKNGAINSPSANPETGDNATITGYGEVSAMNNALAFSALIFPIQNCFKAFSDAFPNGLPIQDELSEIAIDYARSTIRRHGDWTIPTISQAAYNHQMRKILRGTALGAQVYNKHAHPDDVVDCPFGDFEFDDVFYSNKSEYDNYAQHDIMPFHIMIGAALLQMSGNPTDAAYHVEREFNIWLRRNKIAHFHSSGNSSGRRREFEEMDLLTFMSGIDLLFLRAQLFKDAELWTDVPQKRDDLRAFIALFLKNRTSILSDLPEPSSSPSDGSLIISTLRSCVPRNKEKRFRMKPYAGEDRFNREMKQKWEEGTHRNGLLDLNVFLKTVDPGKIWSQKFGERRHRIQDVLGKAFLKPGTDTFEIVQYLESLVRFYVFATVEHLTSVSQSDAFVDRRSLEDARRLYRIAKEEPDLVYGCFPGPESRKSKADNNYDPRVILFRLTVTYGMLLTRKADELAKYARLTRVPVRDHAGFRSALCEANEVLGEALAFSKDLAPEDANTRVLPTGTPVDHEIERAARIVLDIPSEECTDFR